MLIDACNQLFDAGSEFTIRFVGETGDARYFDACRTACQVHSERYLWEGWTDHVLETLRDSAAIVIASRHEGLPQTALEAMHAGRPLISVPVGGVPDLVNANRNGFLSRETSADSLAAAIRSFLEADDQQIERVRTAAKATVRKQADHAKWEKEYVELLRQLERSSLLRRL